MIVIPPHTYQNTTFSRESVSEKGIALVVSLIILLMMGITMSALINRAGKEMDRSNQWETRQDAFSAAETGLQEGQRWLKAQFSTGAPVDKSLPVPTCAGNISQGIDCCSRRMNLAAAFSGPGSQSPLAYEETASLATLVGAKGKSGILRYQFFVAPVDVSGLRTGTGKGGGVGIGRGHKGGGVKSASYYRVWSCGFSSEPTANHIANGSSVRVLEITVSKNN